MTYLVGENNHEEQTKKNVSIDEIWKVDQDGTPCFG